MNAEFDLPLERKQIWVHVDANPDTRYKVELVRVAVRRALVKAWEAA